MWGVEMEAEQKRPSTSRVIIDGVNGAVAQDGCQVAAQSDGCITIPEIVPPARVLVRVIVNGATANTEESIVSADQGAEFRRHPEVPFAYQTRIVSSLLQQRWQGRMVRRQSDIGLARERLFQSKG